jgi:multiple antibiotic resistance protein
MSLDQAITTFVAFFVIIDPIGLVPIFVALTQGMSTAERRRTGLRAVIIGFGLMVFFGFLGEALLGAIGVSMSAFRIAGGILMFLIAVDMLFERRSERRGKRADEEAPRNDPTVFPLATPFFAGPGALATMILIHGREAGDPAGLAMVYGALLAVAAVTVVLFLGAGLIERLLGRVGVTVITRLLGILLAALAVQFVLDGLAEYGMIEV